MTPFAPAREDLASRRGREIEDLNATTQLDEDDTWFSLDTGRRQFL
jgi:hypothetical protein